MYRYLDKWWYAAKSSNDKLCPNCFTLLVGHTNAYPKRKPHSNTCSTDVQPDTSIAIGELQLSEQASNCADEMNTMSYNWLCAVVLSGTITIT